MKRQGKNIEFSIFFRKHDGRLQKDPAGTKLVVRVPDGSTVAHVLDKASGEFTVAKMFGKQIPQELGNLAFIQTDLYDLSIYVSNTENPQDGEARVMRNNRKFDDETQLLFPFLSIVLQRRRKGLKRTQNYVDESNASAEAEDEDEEEEEDVDGVAFGTRRQRRRLVEGGLSSFLPLSPSARLCDGAGAHAFTPSAPSCSGSGSRGRGRGRGDMLCVGLCSGELDFVEAGAGARAGPGAGAFVSPRSTGLPVPRFSSTPPASASVIGGMEEYAKALLRDGCVCIPVAEFNTTAKIEAARAELDREISRFPEFKPAYVHNGATLPDGNKRTLVMGGFSALGNPSSFHNMFVRRLRALLQPHARHLMQSLALLPEFQSFRPDALTLKFCQEIDRLMIRPIGKQATAECWHRDSSPRARPEDIVFGGWLNLDTVPQKFSCKLKSHIEEWRSRRLPNPSDAGFKRIYDKEYLERAGEGAVVSVPPGSLLVFADGILHEVVATPLHRVSERLFTGWRLTHSDNYLIDEQLRGGEKVAHKRKRGEKAALPGERRGIFEKMMAEGAAMVYKADDAPRMYAKMNRNQQPDEIELFSKAAFKDEILEETLVTRTRLQGQRGVPVPAYTQKKMFVPVVIPPLSFFGMRHLYPAYTDQELALHRPLPLFPGTATAGSRRPVPSPSPRHNPDDDDDDSDGDDEKF